MENSRQVVVAASRVPELDVFVGGPGDARVGQRDLDLRAVGVVVKQLQRVCNGRAGRELGRDTGPLITCAGSTEAA